MHTFQRLRYACAFSADMLVLGRVFIKNKNTFNFSDVFQCLSRMEACHLSICSLPPHTFQLFEHSANPSSRSKRNAAASSKVSKKRASVTWWQMPHIRYIFVKHMNLKENLPPFLAGNTKKCLKPNTYNSVITPCIMVHH